MNCTDNGAAMPPRAFTSALNLSPAEKLTARNLIATLAGDRVAIPFEEMADAISRATGLPFFQAAALLEAAVTKHTVSITQDGDRVRLSMSENDVKVRRQPAPTEAELMARLVAQVLHAETAAWAMTLPNLTATLADLTGLTSLQVSKLLDAALPDGGTDVIARMREGVFSLRRRKGYVAMIRMLLHNDGKLEALPIPHAVAEARDVAARYGILPWRETA